MEYYFFKHIKTWKITTLTLKTSGINFKLTIKTVLPFEKEKWMVKNTISSIHQCHPKYECSFHVYIP